MIVMDDYTLFAIYKKKNIVMWDRIPDGLI